METGSLKAVADQSKISDQIVTGLQVNAPPENEYLRCILNMSSCSQSTPDKPMMKYSSSLWPRIDEAISSFYTGLTNQSSEPITSTALRYNDSVSRCDKIVQAPYYKGIIGSSSRYLSDIVCSESRPKYTNSIPGSFYTNASAAISSISNNGESQFYRMNRQDKNYVYAYIFGQLKSEVDWFVSFWKEGLSSMLRKRLVQRGLLNRSYIEEQACDSKDPNVDKILLNAGISILKSGNDTGFQVKRKVTFVCRDELTSQQLFGTSLSHQASFVSKAKSAKGVACAILSLYTGQVHHVYPDDAILIFPYLDRPDLDSCLKTFHIDRVGHKPIRIYPLIIKGGFQAFVNDNCDDMMIPSADVARIRTLLAFHMYYFTLHGNLVPLSFLSDKHVLSLTMPSSPVYHRIAHIYDIISLNADTMCQSSTWTDCFDQISMTGGFIGYLTDYCVQSTVGDLRNLDLDSPANSATVMGVVSYCINHVLNRYFCSERRVSLPVNNLCICYDIHCVDLAMPDTKHIFFNGQFIPGSDSLTTMDVDVESIYDGDTTTPTWFIQQRFMWARSLPPWWSTFRGSTDIYPPLTLPLCNHFIINDHKSETNGVYNMSSTGGLMAYGVTNFAGSTFSIRRSARYVGLLAVDCPIPYLVYITPALRLSTNIAGWCSTADNLFYPDRLGMSSEMIDISAPF